jgi:hypothetical protein
MILIGTDGEVSGIGGRTATQKAPKRSDELELKNLEIACVLQNNVCWAQ